MHCESFPVSTTEDMFFSHDMTGESQPTVALQKQYIYLYYIIYMDLTRFIETFFQKLITIKRKRDPSD